MLHPSKTDRLRHFADDVITHSRDWAATGQDLARTGSHRARRFINKNPMTSTLAGLCIGYLLGKLFTKKTPAPTIPSLGKKAMRAHLRRA